MDQNYFYSSLVPVSSMRTSPHRSILISFLRTILLYNYTVPWEALLLQTIITKPFFLVKDLGILLHRTIRCKTPPNGIPLSALCAISRSHSPFPSSFGLLPLCRHPFFFASACWWWLWLSKIHFYVILVFAFIGFNSTVLTLYNLFGHFVRNHNNNHAALVCLSIGTQTPPQTPRQLWKEYQKVWNRRYYRLFF